MGAAVAAFCLLLGSLAGNAGGQQDSAAGSSSISPKSVPAGRAAKNVAVITIHGEIDKWTAFGVKRRINRAVADGAAAIVFDIDTPGGEMMACLDICNTIKSCPVSNTVAWINPTAYSAGSIIALACREIVVNDPATFGDALPIEIHALMGVKPLPEAEREKLLGPLLAEVVDSARRNGYDEMLVQGLVRRGVELWLVEHTKTGERLFVTEDQYRSAVGADPTRGTPGVPSVTASLSTPAPVGPPQPGSETTGTSAISEGPTSYAPASSMTSTALAREVDAQLDLKGTRTRRPDLRGPEHAGQYREIEYVSDGHGLILLKAEGMIRYRVATDTVKSDADLKAYFGAATVARLNETWSEMLVRFLTFPLVRALLLVVFLLAMFIEMT
ncbi:MAG: hypothetical protein SH850_20885, partial [Planctomycetaceae bacterium]|nr:hypothetical protein [Planctomycetaceae bacterium]